MTTRRVPPPPPALLDWVARYGQVDVDASSEELARGGVQALEASLRLPVDAREAAWALLAADALLTWAVEEAAADPEPLAALEALNAAVVSVSALAEPASPGERGVGEA